MQKNDVLISAELTAPNEIDQPRHAFCRVDGIKQNTLCFGEQVNCLKACFGRYAIALTYVGAID